ncbi:MAG: cation:proton antiporter, partial [Flavobacterium sp.]
SFVSMASAQRIADADKEETAAGTGDEEEKILLAVNHERTVEKMVNLGLLIKNKSNKDKVFALNVINEEKSESSSKNAEKLLSEAVNMGAAADVKINPITRHDNDVIAGINNVVKEQNITDLIIGLEEEKGFSPSFIYNLYNGYLQNKHINLIIYHAVQPVSTIKKYVVLIPADAEREPGFFHCLLRIWNIGKNSGAKMSFYANDKTLDILKSIIKKANIEAVFNAVTSWQEAENMASNLEEDEGLIILMADRGMHSYFPQMKEVPEILNTKLYNNNYLLIYPFSKIDNTVTEKRSVSNLDDFADIGKIIGRIFK